MQCFYLHFHVSIICLSSYLIAGVFIAKGDVGVGTIVGSAVFNILFVIGICGILVTQVGRCAVVSVNLHHSQCH